ncbi:MAG: DnaJ domain-containing protein [Desulfobulbaceae bacterium]|nr:DnaJ domain-containing protein [Desulfobulbaceae bacterium]
MALVAGELELYHACRIIFGAELSVSREFLEYIQLSGVKSAFRKKAMETHPDRMADKSPLVRRRSAHTFHAVQQAYEKLARYVDARDKGFRFTGKKPVAAGAYRRSRAGATPNWMSTPPRNNFSSVKNRWHKARDGHPGNQSGKNRNTFHAKGRYKGTVPQRRLLFGHFLYYSGLADWNTIVKAIVWQKKQPRLGEIAVARGWLTRDDVFHVLRELPRASLPFGQLAVRQGVLTKMQVHVLLAQQKRQHKRFGEFFVLQKILTSQQLTLVLKRFHNHNSKLSFAANAGKF